VAGQQLLVLQGHTGRVISVAFSPDDKRLASASFDNTVKIWEAQTGDELLTLRAHDGWVYSVAFSPDGKRVISGSLKNIKIYDATPLPGKP
jgi:WD40 repeat protein